MSYVAASTPTPRRPLVSQGRRHAFQGPADTILPVEDEGDTRHEIDLRQLRHHTKNTLQRILCLIANTPGLSDTLEGEKIVRELQHRICLSATISNALFGLTDAPGSMAERLRQLTGAVVDMMRDTDQVIRVGVSVRGYCPERLREPVLRCTHELIGNAVKHGMKGRPSGRIAIRLVTVVENTRLTVLDNGWGFTGKPHSGEGLALARDFADQHGGSLSIDGEDGTVATLELPH